MKLDILNSKWLEIVFEGRNKNYGAYELRRESPRTTIKALFIGGLFFCLLLTLPLLANNGVVENTVPKPIDGPLTVVDVVLKPKVVDVKPQATHAPVQPLKKFVKLVVDRADNISEEPPKIVDLKGNQTGQVDIEGDPKDVPTVITNTTGITEVTGDGEIGKIYNPAGIQVQAQFPGGVNAFRAYIAENFRAPKDYGFKGGQFYVSFIVEIDGSISNITVTRDPGYGTADEARRVINSNKVRWIPGEQNGQKVRMLFTLPIKVNAERD